MNDMFIDLDEDEIDRIQDILEFEYAEESSDDAEESSDDEQVLEGSFEWLNGFDTDLPVPFDSKLGIVDSTQTYDNDDIDQSLVDEPQNSALNLNEMTGPETCVTDENSVPSTFDKTDVFGTSNGALSLNENTAEQTYVNDDSFVQSTVDETSAGTSNVVVLKNEGKNANDQNDSDTDPFFSPPSTSSSNFLRKIPSHFARLDPNLHTLLCKQSNDNSQSMAMARKSQMGLEDILEILKLIFPGQCTYVSCTEFIL